MKLLWLSVWMSTGGANRKLRAMARAGFCGIGAGLRLAAVAPFFGYFFGRAKK